MAAVQLRRWTRAEYEQLGRQGILRPDERVELIDGEIIAVSPQGSRHAASVAVGHRRLDSAFGPGFHVRVQLPLALGDHAEPEPDLAVIVGEPEDYLDAHPTTARLVVEVADTTLDYDREVKASLYAAAGVPDYWVMNLVDGRLEVFRDPVEMPGTPTGHGYRTRLILQPSDTISPLARPDVSILVGHLIRQSTRKS